jgi:3-methyladenine DNA glycosylase AlkD
MTAKSEVDERVREALAWLGAHSTPKDVANLERFGINAKNALGVSMANIQMLARRFGTGHELAAALWKSGCYEARMLASLVDEPERVTAAQMERWCRDFDNWGICDTVCFKLFDRCAHAWEKAEEWCGRSSEFQKRAGFALLASLAGHDKVAADAQFLAGLEWIEREAADDRNFVKKGVSWALRRTGTRNAKLREASAAVAQRLSASDSAAARWIGKDALRDLRKADARKRES